MYGTAVEEQSGDINVGLENRDFMRELERQRTAAGDQDASIDEQPQAKTPVAVPVSGDAVPAGESRKAEAEDLDIPAFLRRSR